jgi:hypothetical protein
MSTLLSTRLCVRMEKIGFHQTDFYKIWYFRMFLKTVDRIEVASIKGTLHKDQYIYLSSYLAQIYLEWELFQIKCMHKVKTHILGTIGFFSKILLLWDNVGNILYSGAGHIWQHRSCALHVGYLRLHTQKLTICNTYSFFTTTMVMRTRLTVTLYVHCRPC